MTDLFVSGTDTDVGKTFVTSALAAALRAEGRAVRALKPVASGVDGGPGDDAARLGVAAGHAPLCGFAWRAAVSPHRAAAAEGGSVGLDEVVRWVTAHRGDPTLVEGAGGWEVPCGPSWRIADLAAALGWPVLVVGANRLGVLNHTLLTVAAVRARGLGVAGVVLVGGDGPLAAGNLEDLTALLPDVAVTAFPWVEGDATWAGSALLGALRARRG